MDVVFFHRVKLQQTVFPSTQSCRPFEHDSTIVLSETQRLLPDNLWLRIFSFLTLQERIQVSYVCKGWNNLCKDSLFWREVDFTFCSATQQITDDVVRAVTSYSVAIQSIDLSGDQCEPITDEALCHVARFCQRLQRLDIDGRNNVTNRGLGLIARNCPLLQELNLEKCRGISDKGLQLVAKNCRQLKILSLAGCKKISDKGVRLVAQKCNSMQSLNLAGCSEISDKSLTSIGKYCHSLRSVNLKDIDGITFYGIESLVSGTPELTHVHLGIIRDKQNTMIALQIIVKHCEKLQFLGFQHFYRAAGVTGGVRKLNKKKLGAFINSLNACVVSNHQR